MKDVSRAGLINVYVENRNVPVFSNIVILDVDVSAVMQSIPMEILSMPIMNHRVIGYNQLLLAKMK